MLAEAGSEIHLVVDARNNQLLLRGPDKAQQIAQEVIQTMDRPSGAPPAVSSVLKSYPCPEPWQAEALARLRSAYPQREDVRIAADALGGQLFVLAPPEVHQEIPRHLPVRPEAPAGPARLLGTRSESQSVEQFVPLAFTRVEQVETAVRELLSGRLIPLAGRRLDGREYRFVDGRARRVDLAFDRRQNGVTVFGPGPLASQFVRLVRSLDRPARSDGTAVRVVSVRHADPAKVREAVEAYRSGFGDGATRPAHLDPESWDRQPPGPSRGYCPGNDDQSSRFPHAGIELVSYLFQQRDGGAAGGPGAPGAPPTGQPGPEEAKPLTPEQREERLRELGLDVEIETLPDLDVIILRGRDRDVEEIRKIIEQIERLSLEAEPVIEVYYLRHVSGDALMTIVRQVTQELLAGRQGRVSITPLVKPNALLLIGWGEAVRKAKQLIRRLDIPVDPHTQQRVYRLRHASASRVSSLIQQFFSGRGGLGPQVQVTTDPRTNALIVNASPRDLEEVELLLEKLDTETAEAVMQTRLFRLRNTLAADLATTLQSAIDAARGGGPAGQKSTALELLTVDAKGEKLIRSGILDDVRVTYDPRLNIVIVTAPAECMELVAALVEQLDSPAAVAQIKVFRIVNADATAMVQMLRALLPTQVGLGAQLAAAEGEPSITPLRFSVDLRTNSIIAVGAPGDLRIIEALLTRLDLEDVQLRKTTVYRLKNSPALEVSRAINEFLRTERQVQLAAPGAVSPFLQIESEVVVVPEEVSNSLIISATPRFFKDIEELVQQLDAQPLQVMIQVLIAEVQLRNTDEFGVELGLQDSILFDRSLLDKIETITTTRQQSTPAGIITETEQTVISATNTPGYDFNNKPLGNSGADKALAGSKRVGTQGLSNFATGRVNSELGFGGLVLSASSESVSVLIRALQESQRLEILGRPHIMTLDNQPAFIQIGKRVPRITGTQFAGGFGQTNQIALENVGLILGVTPRISPDGKVVMEIDAEKSELGPEAEGIPVSIAEGTVIRSPSINLTMAQTTVSAADGETIILGGLITKNNLVVDRKVPYLADIPVLGNLFRYKSNQVKRSELLIVLTPHVVRGQDEMERIKRIESARMHWCLDDVLQLHGNGGLLPDQQEPELIYPDNNPRGRPANRPQGKAGPESGAGPQSPPEADPSLLRVAPGQSDLRPFEPGQSAVAPTPEMRSDAQRPGPPLEAPQGANPLRNPEGRSVEEGLREPPSPPGSALPAVYHQR